MTLQVTKHLEKSEIKQTIEPLPTVAIVIHQTVSASSIPRTEKDLSEEKVGKVHVFRPNHIDDRTLWNSFREGNERSFVVIFDRYVKTLHSYGCRIHPDRDHVKDSIQELFIELWKNHKSLGETDAIKFYLYKSLRRKLSRLASKKSAMALVPLGDHHDPESSLSNEDDLIMQQTSEEQKRYVEHLLEMLPNKQREAIYLRYIEEMDYDKIADLMDITKQVVYNLVNKAIQILRKT